ncbi:hypothetical protein [Neptunomonas qingdaonensis]|uniref:hypothetical protein n=1 Tax=Neptunomonas qingdaonensis TaxID=1045558 RepID=UPI0018DB131F|nr:hypothetical protein [Neptunomonas qingdaonensis]
MRQVSQDLADYIGATNKGLVLGNDRFIDMRVVYTPAQPNSNPLIARKKITLL